VKKYILIASVAFPFWGPKAQARHPFPSLGNHELLDSLPRVPLKHPEEPQVFVGMKKGVFKHLPPPPASPEKKELRAPLDQSLPAQSKVSYTEVFFSDSSIVEPSQRAIVERDLFGEEEADSYGEKFSPLAQPEEDEGSFDELDAPVPVVVESHPDDVDEDGYLALSELAEKKKYQEPEELRLPTKRELGTGEKIKRKISGASAWVGGLVERVSSPVVSFF